nr:reverse transcriptase domain-containing protein [Tanacetum cinerariifolium]
MMTDKYCLRGEIKKLEVEMWNLKVKGTDVVNYNQRFQELALMCVRMFPEESDKIEKYVGGLPDMIHGSFTIKCANYKRVGHLTRDCRSPAATNNQRNPTCYECGNQGHYRSDCPELKNQNHRNQAGDTRARGMCMPYEEEKPIKTLTT